MNTFKKTQSFGFPALLDEFLKADIGNSATSFGIKVPPVNIVETERGFELVLAAPGFKKADFNLELNENTLTIFVEVNAIEATEKTQKFTKREFKIGAFKRSFILPESINDLEINANYTDGILHIELPKKELDLSKTKRLIAIS
jgi:HSP20 family protein